jgi:hypothetical protein
MQEQHDLANLFCLTPCDLNPLTALGSDAIDRLQLGGSVLDDSENLGLEPFDHLLRQNRSDPLHQAAAKVSLDPFGCRRRHCFRLVDMMNANVNGTTAPTNAPPASHAHRPVKRQTATLQRKQVTAKAACKGAARL